MKKIIVVNRYFWPETVLINYISQWLVEEGYSVTVITGQPDYHPDANIPTQPRNEIWNGVEIKRITLVRDKGRGTVRNLNSLLFTIMASSVVLFSKDTSSVWCTTIPPVVQPLLLRIVTRMRGIKFVYFVQDIHPEILVSSNILNDSYLAKFLRWADNITLRSADRVVTISNDMLQRVISYGAPVDKTRVIRSFSTEKYDSSRGNLVDVSLPMQFVYAGNVGRFQQIDSLIDVFSQIDSNKAVLKILGNGREKARLESYVKDNRINNVFFYDQLAADKAYEFVCSCHIGVVTLAKNIYKYAYPAKIYTYLGAGLPMLVFVEQESELSKTVSDRAIGRSVSWGNDMEFHKGAVEDLIENYEAYKHCALNKTDDLWEQSRGRREWLTLYSDIE